MTNLLRQYLDSQILVRLNRTGSSVNTEMQRGPPLCSQTVSITR